MQKHLKKLVVGAVVATNLVGLTPFTANPSVAKSLNTNEQITSTALVSQTPFLATSAYKQSSVKTAVSHAVDAELSGTSSVAQAATGAEMSAWLAKLSKHESGNRASLVHLDTNNRYSYGCLQFQRATFDAYTRVYHVTGDIFDCSFQKQLAVLMLQDSYGNWHHWKNTVLAIGLPPRL